MLSILAMDGEFQDRVDRQWFDAGQAAGCLLKCAGTPSSTYSLAGRLVVSKSGWALLEVPNALVRGLFAAMHEPGVELPPGPRDQLNAHISVLRKNEVEELGGAEKINERGKVFHYQLGPMQTIDPAGWPEMSAVYFVKVISPELKKLRVSYGLSPLPLGHDFHITVAVRKKKVLQDNGVSKAADVHPAVSALLSMGAVGGANVILDDLIHDEKHRNAGQAFVDGARLGLVGHAAYRVGGVLMQPRDPETGRFMPTGWTGQPAEPEPPATGPSLQTSVEHYYENTPGGFEAQLDAAIANRKPIPGLPDLKFDASDVKQPVKVESGYLPSTTAGKTNYLYDLATEVPMTTPTITVSDRLPGRMVAPTTEHELTHASLALGPAKRTGTARFPNAPPSAYGSAYEESPSELLPRVADIKRQYVAANPGKSVNTPAEAEAALKWHRDRQMSFGTLLFPTPSDELHGEGWHKWEKGHKRDPQFWDKIKQLMIQVVQNEGGADRAKVAEAIAGIAKEASVLDDLKDAKAQSDRRNYQGKHAIMRTLLTERGGEFAIDSTEGRFHGVTHVPTGFRIHVPRNLGHLATGSLPMKAAADKEAFLGAVAGAVARAAPAIGRVFTRAAPAVGRTVARAIPEAGTVLAGTARAIPAAIGRAAAPVARAIPAAAGQVARATPGAAADTARFAAGVAPGQGFTGTVGSGALPRAWATAKNTYNVMAKPQYPGLDRTVAEKARQTITNAGFGRMMGPAPPVRAFDVPRQLAATALRGGSAATTLATGGIAADSLLRSYPNTIANEVGSGAGLNAQQIAATKERLRGETPGILGNLAKQQMGFGDQSEFSQLHGDVARQALWPSIRSNIYQARQARPWQFGVTDTMRSFTPMGLAATIGTRLAASPQDPDVPGIVRQQMAQHLPGILADPAGTEQSPFYPYWHDTLLPKENLSGLRAAPFNQRVESGKFSFPWGQSLPNRPEILRRVQNPANIAPPSVEQLHEMGPTGVARRYPSLYESIPGMASHFIGNTVSQ